MDVFCALKALFDLVDPIQPPNPNRSFAAVTSNKDFPTPEHGTTQISDQPPLSDLPDVKDMLEKRSGKR